VQKPVWLRKASEVNASEYAAFYKSTFRVNKIVINRLIDRSVVYHPFTRTALVGWLKHKDDEQDKGHDFY